MSYQPLAEVRKTLRVKWYRSKIDHTTLRNLSKRSNLQGRFQAGGHLVSLWLLTGSWVYLFWSHKHIRTEAPDILESSIGELAPKGLK